MPVPICPARAAYAMQQRPLVALHRLVNPGGALAVPGREMHGITVALNPVRLPAEPTEEDYAKPRLALDLIARYDPARFRRLTRDVRYLVIARVTPPSNATSTLGSATVDVDPRSLRRLAVTNLALVLVHEAAPARFDRAGVPSWPDVRPRWERRAGLVELSFARRLPPERFPGVERWFVNRARPLAEDGPAPASSSLARRCSCRVCGDASRRPSALSCLGSIARSKPAAELGR